MWHHAIQLDGKFFRAPFHNEGVTHPVIKMKVKRIFHRYWKQTTMHKVCPITLWSYKVTLLRRMHSFVFHPHSQTHSGSTVAESMQRQWSLTITSWGRQLLTWHVVYLTLTPNSWLMLNTLLCTMTEHCMVNCNPAVFVWPSGNHCVLRLRPEQRDLPLLCDTDDECWRWWSSDPHQQGEAINLTPPPGYYIILTLH